LTDKDFTGEISLKKIYALLLSVREELQRVSSQLRAMNSQQKGAEANGKKIQSSGHT